jgi:hypothetical protein
MASIWKCTLYWTNTTLGTNAQNVVYMKADETITDPSQIGAILDNQFWGSSGATPEMRNWTSTNVKLYQIALQQIQPVPAGGVVYTTAQNFGNAANVVKSPVLGVLFTIKDGGAGRKHRGRFYHYGATQTILTDTGPTAGNIAPTGPIGLTRSALLARFGPTATTALKWQIYHRNEESAFQFTQVSSIAINPRTVVQRRRNYLIGF